MLLPITGAESWRRNPLVDNRGTYLSSPPNASSILVSTLEGEKWLRRKKKPVSPAKICGTRKPQRRTAVRSHQLWHRLSTSRRRRANRCEEGRSQTRRPGRVARMGDRQRENQPKRDGWPHVLQWHQPREASFASVQNIRRSLAGCARLASARSASFGLNSCKGKKLSERDPNRGSYSPPLATPAETPLSTPPDRPRLVKTSAREHSVQRRAISYKIVE